MTEMYREEGGELDDTEARLEMLGNDEANAWIDYYDTTRRLPGTIYFDVEPWAYSLLQDRVARINAYRRSLDGAANAPEN